MRSELKCSLRVRGLRRYRQSVLVCVGISLLACRPPADDDDGVALRECVAVETGTGDVATQDSWRFDAGGTLVGQRLDGAEEWSEIEYVEDDAGRVAEVREDGAVVREFEWDDEGRLASLTRRSSTLVAVGSYEWGDDGYLTSESLAAEGTATTVVQYEYEQGRLALMKVTADGFPVRDTTIEWSEDGCLTGLEHSAGSTSFEADADGRLVLRSMEAGGEVFQTYSTLYEGGPCLPRRLLTAPGGTFIVNPPYGPTVGPICID